MMQHVVLASVTVESCTESKMKLNLGSSDYNKIDVKATEEKYDNGGNCRQDNNFLVMNMCGS